MRKVTEIKYARLHGESLFTPDSGDLGKFLPPNQRTDVKVYKDAEGFIVQANHANKTISRTVELRLPVFSVAHYVVGKEVQIDDPKDS